MSAFKKGLVTVLASFAAGAVFGILIAPAKGCDTRKRASKLFRKCGCCGCCGWCDCHCDEPAVEDEEGLEELKAELTELEDKVNKKLGEDLV